MPKKNLFNILGKFTEENKNLDRIYDYYIFDVFVSRYPATSWKKNLYCKD